MWGVNSRSSSRSIFGLQLLDLNLGSTMYPALVPSMSHIKSCWGVNSRSRSIFELYFFKLNLGSTLALAQSNLIVGKVGGQLWIWIQFQIHLWVVLFDLNLGSTPALGPSMFHLNLLWLFFPDDHFEYEQPYVIFKIECFVPVLYSK